MKLPRADRLYALFLHLTRRLSNSQMMMLLAVVVGVLRAFMSCDPYLSRPCSQPPALLAACRDVWQRYGNGEPQELAALAAQLREYFR